MESLQNIIKKNYQDHHLGNALRASLLVKIVNQKLTDIFGVKNIDNIKCVEYKNNILYLKVKNSLFMQEFLFYKKDLLESLRSKFSEYLIIDFKITLK
jgi:hypothetical protein